MGNAEAALEQTGQVPRLSPLDRRNHFTTSRWPPPAGWPKDDAEGLDWALRAVEDSQVFLALLDATLCFIGLGELERARTKLAAAQSMAPDWFRISWTEAV